MPSDRNAMSDSNETGATLEQNTLPGSLAPIVVCPTAGAIATFIGTTRNDFEGKRVVRLEVCVPEHGREREPTLARSARGPSPALSADAPRHTHSRSTKRTNPWPSSRCRRSSTVLAQSGP